MEQKLSALDFNSKLTIWPENTHKGPRITVQQASCFTCLDSTAFLMVNEQQIYLFGWIQPGQTGGQLYGDNSPYEVSEWFYPCF